MSGTATTMIVCHNGCSAARLAAITDISNLSSRQLALHHLRAAADIINEAEPLICDYEDEDSEFSRREFLWADAAMAKLAAHIEHLRAVVRESSEGGAP
ncbi:MAG: hypothetical protein WC378_05295 [Opitutaceae bacterium]|jgi:hypothetical protein